MKRLLVLFAVLGTLAGTLRAQGRDSSAQIATFQPTTFSPNWPFDYVPLRPAGSTSGLPYLFLSNSFQFDTTNTKSINMLVNNVGTTLGADPCFIEERATVVNLGQTSANCHVVYVGALAGTFGSNNALQVNATASFARNASTQGAGKLNATGTLTTCRSITTNAQCWGETAVVTDTGGGVGIMIGNETDVIIQNPVANYTGSASNPTGFKTAITSGSNPGILGTAFSAQRIGGGIKWNVGYATQDSSVNQAFVAGAAGTQANQNSQPYVACYRDAGATSHCYDLAHSDQFGQLVLGTGAANTIVAGSSGQLILQQGGFQQRAVALSCGSATTPALDPRTGSYFTCNITSNVAVVVAIPSPNPPSNQSETIVIALRNTSGGALTTAPTFNTGAGGFKFTGSCNPANGTQCVWAFAWDSVQSFWYMIGAAPTGL